MRNTRRVDRFTIYVSGVAYGGIDYEGGEDARPEMGVGFHHAPGMGRDALKWGGEPYVIDGITNLKGHVGRILDRMRDGTIAEGEIVIMPEVGA